MDDNKTRKERRESKKLQQYAKPKDYNTVILTSTIALVSAAMIGLFLLSNGQSEKKSNIASEEIVSQQGVHWDPTVDIFIKGKKQLLPDNLGLMGGHNPVHTHNGSDGMAHYEYPSGPVTKSQLKLGNFFKLWGKPFNSTQIFDSKNGTDGKVTMTVNGAPNTEFDNYQIKEKDKIEIRYE